MKGMHAIKLRVDQALSAALVFLFATLTIDVLWQVLSRYALGSPASFTEEVARFAFMWLAMLGSAYVAGQQGHLAIDLFPQSLGPESRRKVEVGLLFIGLVFVLIAFVWGGISLVSTSLELGQRSPVLGVPLGVVYMVVPLAGLLFTFYLAFDAMKRISSSPEEGGDA